MCAICGGGVCAGTGSCSVVAKAGWQFVGSLPVVGAILLAKYKYFLESKLRKATSAVRPFVKNHPYSKAYQFLKSYRK